MAKIFLVNVGANTGHASYARSPIFENDEWVYVPFPDKGRRERKAYSEEAFCFTRNIGRCETHNDPDWKNLTYGDLLRNRRGAALEHARVGDILLFWGLLWRNTKRDWSGWTGEKGWYLFGAITIEEILVAGQRPSEAKANNRSRAAENAHVREGKIGDDERVFIGCKERSRRFEKAVDLGIYHNSGLLFQAIRTADGREVSWYSKPKWNSVTRPCRAVFDLLADDRVARAEGRKRADLVKKAIRDQNNYNLLDGI